MNENHTAWTEADSETFIVMSTVAVPSREEQMATVTALLPFEREAEFRVAELSSGQGLLAYTLLDCFPNARLLALDLSVTMLAKASELLTPFLNRCELDEFDLLNTDWLERIDRVDSVVSSLTVHHLSGEGKQELFRNVFERLTPGGAFIIADLVHPQRPEANELFAETWDFAAEDQSVIETGGLESYELFLEEKWNHYRYPDDTDTPSPLFDQLQWMSAAGFTGVDCFWMRAGHAVYGGYKPGGSPPHQPVGFEAAFDSAVDAINASLQLDLRFDWRETE